MTSNEKELLAALDFSTFFGVSLSIRYRIGNKCQFLRKGSSQHFHGGARIPS